MSAGQVESIARAPNATAREFLADQAPAVSTPPCARINPRRSWRRHWRLAVAALLAVYATMAFTASLGKGQSFDEGLQLAVGYNIWLNDDFRIEGANGDLIKRWTTLPYLVSRPHFPSKSNSYWKHGMPYELAHRFFFQLGNRPEALLQQARAMNVLLGVAAGLLVCWCAREIFGAVGGLVSLTVFAFSPHMLAFGGIVSTDMSITLTLFGSTWCIWRLLHRVTAWRLAVSLGCFGALVLAKVTALVIFPVTLVMLAIRFIAGGPLTIGWKAAHWTIVRRRHQAAIIFALALLHALAGWTAIWAHYGFRYPASPAPGDPTLTRFQLSYRDDVPPALNTLIQKLKHAELFPEGFLHGVELLLGNDDELCSFMRGEWKVGGRPLFFPYAIWVKTQPTLFLLLALGVMLWWCRRSRANPAAPHGRQDWNLTGGRCYRLTPCFALIACYLAIAMTDDLNIGHRHVLPIYPALYVLAGGVGLAWRNGGIRWVKIAVLLLLTWRAADSFAARPHYLAYFGPQAGGADEGYKHLVDSSLDWGTNLPGLRRWLDRHDPQRREPLFLAYFGTDSPTYHGIECQRLPGFFDRRRVEPYGLTPGYYAISASLLQSVYTPAFGAWSKAYENRYQIALRNMQALEQAAANPAAHPQLTSAAAREFLMREFPIFDGLRFGRLCAWLRHHREPDHAVGHAILIWKLDLADLESALIGPPVELTDDPLPPRHHPRFPPLQN